MERLKAALASFLCLILASPTTGFAQSAPASRPSTRQGYQSGELQGDDRILQALNRFTFGTRPGDIEAVRAMGLEKWFTQQLHPETIGETELQARLDQFPAMQWSTQDLLFRLPSNGVIRQAAEGKIAVPPGGALHSVYVDEIARYQGKQQDKEKKKQQQASMTANATMTNVAMNGQDASGQAMNSVQAMTNGQGMNGAATGMASDARQTMVAPVESGQMMAPAATTTPDAPGPDQAEIARVIALPPAQRVAYLVGMQQPDFDAFRKALKGPQRIALNTGLNPAQKEVVLALEGPQHVVGEELIAQRLTHDIYSNAQLQEVMTDFWLNHFNVYSKKNEETPYYLVSYERDVIRPRALGKFEDLLEATAHSPAMLLYLDNSTSIGPDSPQANKAKMNASRRTDGKKPAPEGLNENYARELMELHTLGVNGGYTQADVTQVARVLTGWTVDKPNRGGDFKFDETRHEPGVKKVLGKKFKEHGEQEGVELLHMLATRPATAKFISRKLAIRFVGDDPPQSLVDRMAKTYMSSDGDISAVLKTLFHSPELWSPDDYRAKVKTPLEYVVSAARASNANIDNLQPLLNALRDMGMPLYGAVPPTGYKWDASDWVSTGALVTRMNFALTLAANKYPGITVTWAQPPDSLVAKVDDGTTPHNIVQPAAASSVISPPPSPEAEEQRLETLLVDGGVSPTTRAAVLNQFNAQIQTLAQTQNGQNQPAAKPTPVAKPMNPTQAATALEKQDQLLAGLLLGSPEFQRR
jgi:uncharacterized protein (DUF1800 family)